jgi:hypothetical protein
MRLFKIIICIGTILNNCSVIAANDGAVDRAVLEITKELCAAPPPLAGSTTTLEASGKINATLSKLFKKLADAGVTLEGNAKQQSYSGVLQTDIAGLIKGAQDCRKEVYFKLLDLVNPKGISSPSKPVTLKWVEPAESAAKYAERWIGLLDQSRLSEAYDALDKDQKTAYTLDAFQDQLLRALTPQGKLVSRTLNGAQPAPRQADTPPDSKFFIVAFRTKWEHGRGTGFPGDEVIILRLSPNGKWQVARYICLACISE